MSSVVKSAACSADHSDIISYSLITPAKNASVLLNIFLFVSELLRTTETFHVNERRTGVSFRSRAVARLSMTRAASAIQIDQLLGPSTWLLLKLRDNMQHHQRHSQIWHSKQTQAEYTQDTKQMFLALLLRQKKAANLLLRLSTKTLSKLNNQTCSNSLENPLGFHKRRSNRTPDLDCPPPHNKRRTSQRYACQALRYHDVHFCLVVVDCFLEPFRRSARQ